jgi:hypothetical protein
MPWPVAYTNHRRPRIGAGKVTATLSGMCYVPTFTDPIGDAEPTRMVANRRRLRRQSTAGE